MIDREHDLPITRQAEILRISRGSVYYLPRPVSATDLALMRRLDELHLEFPFAGSRMLRGLVAAEGCKVGRRFAYVPDVTDGKPVKTWATPTLPVPATAVQQWM